MPHIILPHVARAHVTLELTEACKQVKVGGEKKIHNGDVRRGGVGGAACKRHNIEDCRGACDRTSHSPERSVTGAPFGLINSAAGSMVLKLYHL